MDKPTTDLERPSWERRKWPWIALVIAGVIVLFLLLNQVFKWYSWPWSEQKVPAKNVIQDQAIKPKPSRVIDYGKIKEKSDEELQKLIQERKKKFGLDKSVDMVVKAGETIRVGKEVIPLNQILGEIEAQKKGTAPSIESFLKRPKIAEEDISLKSSSVVSPLRKALNRPSQPDSLPSSEPSATKEDSMSRATTPAKSADSYYGIYVVRPGDNLWNIHFAFLREHLGSRGFNILPDADEPFGNKSSGVGRILKFAESMVSIFNIKTMRLSEDLNLLEPHEKIVIFNLTLLHNILGSLTVEQLDVIRFDGRDLLLPD
ncbi:MAG: hypothetical protein JRG97_12705 [Deltaproteobacteria bacterium]|nr:hypothetical protein [Deltaproteobacteria bacterium]